MVYFIGGMNQLDYIMKIVGTGCALVIDVYRDTNKKWTDGNEFHSKNSTTLSTSTDIFTTVTLMMPQQHPTSLQTIEDTWRNDQ